MENPTIGIDHAAGPGKTVVTRLDDCRPVKIFKLNGCDWYAAYTLEEAIEQACKDTGLDREDLLEDPYEVGAEALNHLTFVDEEKDKNGENKRYTFREQLNRMIINGEKFPCMFASTEY